MKYAEGIKSSYPPRAFTIEIQDIGMKNDDLMYDGV